MGPRAVEEVFKHYGEGLGVVEGEGEESEEEGVEEELELEESSEEESGMINTNVKVKSEFVRKNSSIKEAACQKSVYLSIMQIYMEQITDLLSENSPKLKLRRN